MKASQVSILVLLLSLLALGCSDPKMPEPQTLPVGTSIPVTEGEIVKVARVVLDSEIHWKDSITDDGCLIKLFQPSAPNSDETRHYRVKEGERIFAILLSRFGSIWKGTVVNLSGDDSMHKFEGTSAEDCLSAIHTEFQFTGEIEQVVGCFFHEYLW